MDKEERSILRESYNAIRHLLPKHRVKSRDKINDPKRKRRAGRWAKWN